MPFSTAQYENFLILMLMALLPLAGWAADLKTEATVTVNDKYFGIAPTVDDANVVVNSTSLATAKYKIESASGKVVFYTDEALTTKASYATTGSKNTPNAGTYYIKIQPADDDNSGYAAGKVIIKPIPLTVTVDNTKKRSSTTRAQKTLMRLLVRLLLFHS